MKEEKEHLYEILRHYQKEYNFTVSKISGLIKQEQENYSLLLII